MDILFPPSEESLIVRKTSLKDLTIVQDVCDVDGVRVLLPFSDTRVRACIHEAKFSHNVRAQKLLGAVYAANARNENPSIIIPVPLSRKRKNERGYNQVTEIARHARARMPGYFLKTNILKRSKDTKPQTELGKAERAKNMQNVFRLIPKNVHLIKGKDIILLDDVITTGATLREAKKELQKAAPRSITCTALAH